MKTKYERNVLFYGKEIADIIDEFYGNYEDNVDSPTEGAFEMAQELLKLRSMIIEIERMVTSKQLES